jgi:hypothetical protein
MGANEPPPANGLGARGFNLRNLLNGSPRQYKPNLCKPNLCKPNLCKPNLCKPNLWAGHPIDASKAFDIKAFSVVPGFRTRVIVTQS